MTPSPPVSLVVPPPPPSSPQAASSTADRAKNTHNRRLTTFPPSVRRGPLDAPPLPPLLRPEVPFGLPCGAILAPSATLCVRGASPPRRPTSAGAGHHATVLPGAQQIGPRFDGHHLTERTTPLVRACCGVRGARITCLDVRDPRSQPRDPEDPPGTVLDEVGV